MIQIPQLLNFSKYFAEWRQAESAAYRLFRLALLGARQVELRRPCACQHVLTVSSCPRTRAAEGRQYCKYRREIPSDWDSVNSTTVLSCPGPLDPDVAHTYVASPGRPVPPAVSERNGPASSPCEIRPARFDCGAAAQAGAAPARTHRRGPLPHPPEVVVAFQ